MLRNRTLPARRAALTMTVTAGFCMAKGSREGEWVGLAEEKSGPGARAGRAVYHLRLSRS
jgi:hypothetical protein